MKKDAVGCSILIAFLVLCFALFALPAVRNTTYREGASGYKALFGEANVRRNGLWIPHKLGVCGVITLICFFTALIFDSIALILVLKDSEKWTTCFLIGAVSALMFNGLYIFWRKICLKLSLATADMLPINIKASSVEARFLRVFLAR